MSTLPAQALPRWRRAVLKVGSNLLAADGGGLTPRHAEALAAFIAASHAEGREVVLVDDYGGDGVEMLTEIRGLYDAQRYETEILAASVRTAAHVAQAALAGADAATLPPAVFSALIKHPLTDAGLDKFMSDWKKTGQRIA